MPAGSDGGATSAAPDNAGGPGTIRQLTLSPITSGGSSHSEPQAFVSPSYVSGGPAPAYYPTLFGSGGSKGTELAPGEDAAKPKHWVFTGKLPVGAMMQFRTSIIDTSKVDSFTWGGGTDFKSYLSGSPNDDSSTAKSMSLTTGVATNQSIYNFIAPPQPGTFTVTVTIHYKPETNGQAPDSVLDAKFTTVAPTTATLSVANTDKGDIGAATTDGGLIQLGLWRSPPGTTPTSSGIRITASTTADAEVGGSFMFLQVVKDANYIKDTNNKVEITSPIDERVNPPNYNTSDWNLDDGNIGKISYPSESDVEPVVSGWSLAAGATNNTQAMNDSPRVEALQAATVKLKIGTDGPNNTLIPEPFVTYLMYKGPGGVWVAQSKVNWSFGAELVTNPLSVYKVALQANASSAIGEWPSWIGRGSQVQFR